MQIILVTLKDRNYQSNNKVVLIVLYTTPDVQNVLSKQMKEHKDKDVSQIKRINMKKVIIQQRINEQELDMFVVLVSTKETSNLGGKGRRVHHCKGTRVCKTLIEDIEYAIASRKKHKETTMEVHSRGYTTAKQLQKGTVTP